MKVCVCVHYIIQNVLNKLIDLTLTISKYVNYSHLW